MSGLGKDSAEVAEFMWLFATLKSYWDDAPEDLVDLARTDTSVRDICSKLFSAAHLLQMNERRRCELFAAPVDPRFVDAWRDYEKRFESVLSGISLYIVLNEPIGDVEPSNTRLMDLKREIARYDGINQATGIEEAIEFARCNAEQEDRWVDRPEYIEQIWDGIAAWERLTQDTEFDLKGVFRRRALVPFVLVPRHVAAKYGSAETPSMLKNLQQAHDAFVFGAPFAALALMRSTLEAVLRDRYGAAGKDLSERIRNAGPHLPPGANKQALHRLRKLANAILHPGLENDEAPPKINDEQLEEDIVSLLGVLRNLIEGAPVVPTGGR